jgi:hypothetical protein
MHQKSGLWTSLRATSRSDWWQSCLMMLYTLGGGLAPLWIGWPLAKLYNRQSTLADFSLNGEFALYCAAVVAPAIYLVVHERAARLGGQAILTFVAFILWFMAIVFYVFALPVPGPGTLAESFNKPLYAKWTFCLFIIGALFLLVVTALDLMRSPFDPRKIRREDEDELHRDYERLGGGV